jgi:hypothetical protein
MDEGRFEVKDGDRTLKFTGVCLGEASSFRPGKDRWAELAIHRTAAGKYVVSGCGRSTRAGDQDKHWAEVCDRPDAVIEKLHMLDSGRARYLPRVNREVLEQARENDPDFERAYLVQEIA